MKFNFEKGKKHPLDLVMRVTAENEKVLMEDVARMCRFFYANEEILYPPPAKGGKFFLDFINQAMLTKTKNEFDKIVNQFIGQFK